MKRICLFVLFLCIGFTLVAQEKPKPGGIFDHVIEVETYSDWGQGYLTVIDPHYFFIGEELFLTTFNPAEENGNNDIPDCGDILLELNGISLKNMSPKQFYALTDTATIFTLKWADRTKKEYTQKLIVARENNDLLSKYVKHKDFMTTTPVDSSSLAKLNKQSIFSCISNTKYDFRNAKTYDYVIIGGDPLNDEKILDKIDKYGLIRDTKKPDILSTIAKNADEKISSTYIPPTSRTVNTGSTTTSRYNYITKTFDYQTHQHNQTIREGGYTETTKTANIFLELAALDAKKVNDKSISYVPVIWQMTANRSVTNYNFNMNDEYRSYATWAYLPPLDRTGRKEVKLYERTGLVADESKPALVAKVEKGSRAEKAGFQEGDIITKIECHYTTNNMINSYGNVYWYVYDYTITEKNIILKSQYNGYGYHPSPNKFKREIYYGLVECLETFDGEYNKDGEYQLLSHKVTVTVLRNKKKLELTMQPNAKILNRYYWLDNATLEKVRK